MTRMRALRTLEAQPGDFPRLSLLREVAEREICPSRLRVCGGLRRGALVHK